MLKYFVFFFFSFHVGSGCSDPRAFSYTIPKVRNLFDYAKEVGFDFTILNIGGGLPGLDSFYPVEKVRTVLLNFDYL